MSTDTGDQAVTKEFVDQAMAQLAEAAAEEEQLSLIEPLTADEIDEAKLALGAGAGMVTVLREARKRRAGRPKGSRNKRQDDFARWIGQFGQDPAIGLMQVASMTPEELVARSRLIDPPKRQLSYGDALDRIIRCREALMPFMHSKKPVAADVTIRGVIVQQEIGEMRPARGSVIDSGIIGVVPPEDDE